MKNIPPRTIKIAVTPSLRMHIHGVETIEVDVPENVRLHKTNPGGLVRYCPECGSVGEIPRPASTCCPGKHKAIYVTADVAEQARSGLKLALLHTHEWSDSQDSAPTPGDYRELQLLHDKLQSELYSTRHRLDVALVALGRISHRARQAIKGVE